MRMRVETQHFVTHYICLSYLAHNTPRISDELTSGSLYGWRSVFTSQQELRVVIQFGLILCFKALIHFTSIDYIMLLQFISVTSLQFANFIAAEVIQSALNRNPFNWTSGRIKHFTPQWQLGQRCSMGKMFALWNVSRRTSVQCSVHLIMRLHSKAGNQTHLQVWAPQLRRQWVRHRAGKSPGLIAFKWREGRNSCNQLQVQNF